jgi:hypothetical protein
MLWWVQIVCGSLSALCWFWSAWVSFREGVPVMFGAYLDGPVTPQPVRSRPWSFLLNGAAAFFAAFAIAGQVADKFVRSAPNVCPPHP